MGPEEFRADLALDTDHYWGDSRVLSDAQGIQRDLLGTHEHPSFDQALDQLAGITDTLNDRANEEGLLGQIATLSSPLLHVPDIRVDLSGGNKIFTSSPETRQLAMPAMTGRFLGFSSSQQAVGNDPNRIRGALHYRIDTGVRGDTMFMVGAMLCAHAPVGDMSELVFRQDERRARANTALMTLMDSAESMLTPSTRFATQVATHNLANALFMDDRRATAIRLAGRIVHQYINTYGDMVRPNIGDAMLDFIGARLNILPEENFAVSAAQLTTQRDNEVSFVRGIQSFITTEGMAFGYAISDRKTGPVFKSKNCPVITGVLASELECDPEGEQPFCSIPLERIRLLRPIAA